MADSITIPMLKLEIPKPRPWDFIALLILVASIGLAGANMFAATSRAPGVALSSFWTYGALSIQLLICMAGTMVLGKTAKEGTIHGNLFAVGAMLMGMSGVLLAAGLWAAA